MVIGPEDATGVRWARHHSSAAYAVTASQLPALEPILTRLRDDSESRVAMANAAPKIAAKTFNPQHIRKRFVNLLCDAARK
jgi:hypothetical protein